jgi:hypothetical protein
MVHAYNLQIIVGEILRYLCDLYEALGSLASGCVVVMKFLPGE